MTTNKILVSLIETKAINSVKKKLIDTAIKTKDTNYLVQELISFAEEIDRLEQDIKELKASETQAFLTIKNTETVVVTNEPIESLKTTSKTLESDNQKLSTSKAVIYLLCTITLFSITSILYFLIQNVYVSLCIGIIAMLMTYDLMPKKD
jgi:seryl-tRNA synthetase